MAAPAARQGILPDQASHAHVNQVPGLVTLPAIALNSNESAFGPSPYAQFVPPAVPAGNMERYCENPAQILVPAIAGRFGLDPDYIAIGPGSDDLLCETGACLSRTRYRVDSEAVTVI